ncbi:MAG TPA: right-handed parallel beta-helix repeat-containing protein, partial [Pirellulales bacterium]|nr:right-handed parallel beta-helix repeat-containing protein [Pirellulales bacterium]
MSRRRRVRKLPLRAKGRCWSWEWLEQRLLLTNNWSGTIPNGTVWDNSQVQQITGNVDIPAGATLTIQPGTVVKFDNGTTMTVDGTLNASGTSGQQIYFTSFYDDSIGGDTDGDGGTIVPVRGQWGQVLFTSTSTADVLNDAVVRYGGGGVDAEVEAKGAAPTLSNSVFSDSPGFGVRLTGSNATLTNDTFQNDDLPENGSGVGGAIHMDVSSQPTLQNITFTNNYVNGVWVDPGTLPTGTTTWNNPDVVYFVPRTVTVPQGSALTVSAGQIVKLARSLVVGGTISVSGTAAQPVVFTSYHDNSVGGATIQDGNTGPARGDWGQIQFTSTSTNDMLDNVLVNFGGGGFDAEVEADSASPVISNSVFANSPGFGLRLSGSHATLTGDTFQHNDTPENGNGVGGAIHMDVNSQPVIEGASFSDNYVNAVWIDP